MGYPRRREHMAGYWDHQQRRYLGATVTDREAATPSPAAIVAVRSRAAYEVEVANIGQSVAEYNPDYPDDDIVVRVAFMDDLDRALGSSWHNERVDVVKSSIEEHNTRADGEQPRRTRKVQLYDYPVSRLQDHEGDPREMERLPRKRST